MAWTPINLDRLRILDQPDRGGKLRIFESRGQSGHGLGMSDPCRQFEDLLGQMIDSVQMAAAAGDENAFADVVDERFFLQLALQELECFAQPQMNDRV